MVPAHDLKSEAFVFYLSCDISSQVGLPLRVYGQYALAQIDLHNINVLGLMRLR